MLGSDESNQNTGGTDMAKKADDGKSKSEMIREVAKEGMTAKEIVDELGKRGIEVSIGLVNQVRSSDRKKTGTAPKRGGRRGRRAAEPAHARIGVSNFTSQLLTLKGLVKELGADEVKSLVDVVR